MQGNENDRDLVTELLADQNRRERRYIALIVALVLAFVATNGYWIYVINSYEYVSQDGTGINTINTGHQEDIDYGAEDAD